jgi:hypothetical protein
MLLCSATLLLTFTLTDEAGDGAVVKPPLRLLFARDSLITDPLSLDAFCLEKQIDNALVNISTQGNPVDKSLRTAGIMRTPRAFEEKSPDRVKVYTRLSVKKEYIFSRFGVRANVGRSYKSF